MPVRLQSATARLARLNPSLEAFSPNFDGAVDAPASFTATIGANLQADTASFLGNYQAVSDITGTIGVTLDNFTSNITSNISQTVPYDLTLGGTRSLPFSSYTWPTAPTTTSTINVSANDGAGLLSAIRTAGARVVVPAGTYSTSLTGWADDVDVVMDNGATINLTGSCDFFNAQRVRITGGAFDGGGSQTMYQAGGSDYSFINTRFDNFFDIQLGVGAITRMALVNVTADSTRYCMFCQQTEIHNDIIIAACDLYGGNPSGAESTVRMMGVTHGIVVDSRLRNGGKHTFRVHFASDNIWAQGNQFETGNGIMWDNHPIGGGTLQCDDGWVIGNKMYAGWSTFQGYFASGNDGTNRLRFQDNEEYVAGSPSFPYITDTAAGPGWVISGNTDGLTGTPAAMPNAGADH